MVGNVPLDEAVADLGAVEGLLRDDGPRASVAGEGVDAPDRRCDARELLSRSADGQIVDAVVVEITDREDAAEPIAIFPRIEGRLIDRVPRAQLDFEVGELIEVDVAGLRRRGGPLARCAHCQIVVAVVIEITGGESCAEPVALLVGIKSALFE